MGASCWECGKYFPSGMSAVNNHCYSTGHEECRISNCCHRCESSQDRIEHEADAHSYCVDCNRRFMSPNNARQHRNSKAHRDASVECPLCKKAYTTATGIVHHLESGACPSAKNLSRDAVYRFVRSRDPQGVISKKLIGWTGENEYEATSRTWNGSGYECYLCHREFGTLWSLNQHLKSPAHQQAYYHCPKATCRTEFKTLASFINHLESESCGYMRFGGVQKQVTSMMAGGRLIGY